MTKTEIHTGTETHKDNKYTKTHTMGNHTQIHKTHTVRHTQPRDKYPLKHTKRTHILIDTHTLKPVASQGAPSSGAIDHQSQQTPAESHYSLFSRSAAEYNM